MIKVDKNILFLPGTFPTIFLVTNTDEVRVVGECVESGSNFDIYFSAEEMTALRVWLEAGGF